RRAGPPEGGVTGLRRPAPVPRSVRTPLTLVDAVTRERTEVLVDLDPATPASALEAAVASALHPRAAGLWLGGAALDGPVGSCGLGPGSVLGLGGPVEDLPSGPAVRVLSGAQAGAVLPLREHLRLGAALVTAGPAGVVVQHDGSASVLRPGDLLDLGDRTVTLCADLPHTGRTGLETVVTRPPRLRPALAVTTVEVPEPPAPVQPRRLPVVPLLLPVVLGVVMALVSSPLFLLFTLLSPLLALSTWWTDRGQARRTNRDQAAAHEAALAGFAGEVARLRQVESAARHEAAPHPATLLSTARDVGPRLWERRRADDDALVLRVGTGLRPPTSYRLSIGTPDPLDVPVSLALREVGVLGVTDRATARWLVGQAAVLHSPRDLGIWLLADPARAEVEAGWDWLRWLPHSASERCGSLVGTTAETVAARLQDLSGIVASRTAGAKDVRAQLEARQLPDLLVVLDGAHALRSLAGVPALLRDGPAVGVHVVCVEERELLLPEECQAVVTTELRVQGCEPVPFRPDLPTGSWTADLGRALAPLRDGGSEGEAEVPASARLLDVLGMDPPTAAGVRARWGRTTAAVVGVDADGPVVLDLRRDGPHALVAGTTGAGKSELLQTLVASLAVANRPDAMSFVLIDYKGGAAFKDCARLPHTVGMVTDLDGHLVERALASLTAELTARELQLAAAGAKDIEDLWDGGGSLARLVIVIDEFASLAEELPDFVRGLVGIAQRGRSLGVHLVLATQRPSGVVSPEIRANTNLRIALRVTEAAESLDVLDAPDAASVPRSLPGRAFARTGHSTLFPFQAARVGGRRPGLVDAALHVLEVPWSALGRPLPAAPLEETPDDATDLHALVEAVRAASEGVELPRRPWLEALPVALPVPAASPLVLPFGVEDHPGTQSQRTAALDLVHGGHLLVAGAARSGRTTLLRALAASLAAATSADDVHLYALDCGGGSLLELEALPHTGAVVTRSQPDRAERLLARLSAEVTRRQELLAAAGWSDLAEQRAGSASPLPYLLLMVDRWEGFTAFEEHDTGRLPDALLRLVRDGLSVGLRVVVTGDRTALIGKLSQAVEDTVVLRLAERSDYSLAGLSPRSLPEVIGDGRGFRGGVELQVGLLCEDPPGTAQGAALAAAAAAAVAGVCRPFRVDVLPTRLARSQCSALPAESCGIAVGGDELGLLGLDPSVPFTIAGPPRSGRSTAL
ncbi:MAG: putative cell division-related protein, partial [Frankiales bacterium]|nr:putative cell division-related protein [Frankiales bacterium]